MTLLSEHFRGNVIGSSAYSSVGGGVGVSTIAGVIRGVNMIAGGIRGVSTIAGVMVVMGRGRWGDREIHIKSMYRK